MNEHTASLVQESFKKLARMASRQNAVAGVIFASPGVSETTPRCAADHWYENEKSICICRHLSRGESRRRSATNGARELIAG